MTTIRTRAIPVLLLAAVAAGCGSARPAAAQVVVPPGAEARPDSTRYPWTEADAAFMQAMIAHHAQAIEMAELAPERAESPSIRTLAARIINSQQDEIATMRQWLRDRGQPVPEIHPTAHHAHVHGAHMPGMLTAAQLRELEQATGAEFDRLFLTYMIQHHRGAVDMVSQLFGTRGAGLDEMVFRFASDVNVDQTTEIARMQRMLADLLFGEPAP